MNKSVVAPVVAVKKEMSNAHNLRASQASLATSCSSCPLTHHYHYIDYPAYFKANNVQQTALAQMMPTGQCHCPCSCGGAGINGLQQQQQHNNPTLRAEQTSSQQQQQQLLQQDSQLAVAVIVHQQANGATSDQLSKHGTLKTTQSAQSLLNHSYQALHIDAIPTPSTDLDDNDNAGATEQKPLNIFDGTTAAERAVMKQNLMLAADEITVSESDNNSTMVKTKKKKQPRNACCARDLAMDVSDDNIISDNSINANAGPLPEKKFCSVNDIYHDNELIEGAEYYMKSKSNAVGAVGVIANSSSVEDNRPPLPPRPPMAVASGMRQRARDSLSSSLGHRGTGIKKYVVWCLICGGFSCLLGVLFLGVYFLLHSYTITVGNFETIPTFVPATLLILTGVCVMSLARRRNRYSYLIKLSGGCGLTTALTCALVTVTTTVLHMSRLQALRECEYAQKTRTCTCYSDMIESQVDRVDKEGVRLVFDSLSDCGVVHGSLYSCLRAIFGLSVAGVLISVFSCMLVYQLLSHERKKMYWEQLELRCRSLYASQAPPPSNMAAMAAAVGPGRMVNCRCCEQCHAHRQLQMPLQATSNAYPWDDNNTTGNAGAEQRFWAAHPPGNFYSPNPGVGGAGSGIEEPICRGHNGTGVSNVERARSSGWSWPRMPWQRNTPDGSRRFRQAATSPDSQYGFSSTSDGNMLIEENMPVATVATPHGTGGTAAFSQMLPTTALPYGVWGPPPPYSDPNSPARRGYYQYLQPNVCLGNVGNVPDTRLQAASSTNALIEPRLTAVGCQHQTNVTLERPDSAMNNSSTACLAPITAMNASTTLLNRNGQSKRQHNASQGVYKAKATEYENTHVAHSDSDGCSGRERCSNTLPTRKLKRRIEIGAKSIGPNNNQSNQRPNVQQVFAAVQENIDTHNSATTAEAAEAEVISFTKNTQHHCRQTTTAHANVESIGVENTGYQCNAADSNGGIAQHGAADVSESEVYFADVSSCCNMSVKNDNYYEDTNTNHHHLHRHQHHQHAQHNHHHQHHQHQHQHSNCSHLSSSSNQSNANTNEDYLAQRFGRRENSIRSRLPFPQTRLNGGDGIENYTDDAETTNLNISTLKHIGTEQQQTLQKDISRQSMCSVESEAKTEFTDLSPSTPCGNVVVGVSNNSQLPPPPANFAGDKTTNLDSNNKTQTPNFVASFPFASAESQCLEAHRRSTKMLNNNNNNNESHYEVINDQRGGGGVVGNYQVTGVGVGAGAHAQRPTNLGSQLSSNATAATSRQKSRSREQLENVNYLMHNHNINQSKHL